MATRSTAAMRSTTQGLYWFEEPITYSNLSGYAELRRKLKTPIQLGENFYGPRSLFQALSAGAGDYVMPDLMRIGGVTGWLRAAAMAGAAGIEMSTHLYPEFSAHLMRVTETAHWLEWQDWANPILAEPFELADGCIFAFRTVSEQASSGTTKRWGDISLMAEGWSPANSPKSLP